MKADFNCTDFILMIKPPRLIELPQYLKFPLLQAVDFLLVYQFYRFGIIFDNLNHALIVGYWINKYYYYLKILKQVILNYIHFLEF
jgi:hypothetical protein